MGRSIGRSPITRSLIIISVVIPLVWPKTAFRRDPFSPLIFSEAPVNGKIVVAKVHGEFIVRLLQKNDYTTKLLANDYLEKNNEAMEEETHDEEEES